MSLISSSLPRSATFIVAVVVVEVFLSTFLKTEAMSVTTAAAAGDSASSDGCPTRCNCRPSSEAQCDWCFTFSQLPSTPSVSGSVVGPLSEPSVSNPDSAGGQTPPVEDNVSCEGCGGAALIEEQTVGHHNRHRPSTEFPQSPETQLTVTCSDSGLTAVPLRLPLSAATLDFTGNQLRQLDASFLDFVTDVDRRPGEDETVIIVPRLVNVRLKKNRIDWIVPGAFRGPSAQSIRVLDLSENRLTRIEPGSFAGCAESLINLDLSGNSLTDLGDGMFSSMRQLVKLDLRDNSLVELGPGAFRGLTMLRQLILGGNMIKTIDRRAFRHLERLVYIVLKGNPLGDQQIRFQFHSPSLNYIDLSECRLLDVPKGLPGSARYVQLRRNNITTISRTAFVESPFIDILVLDDNKIADIDDGAFERLTRLQQLWIGGNRLQRVPSALPVSLRRLLLDFNRIEQLTDIFPNRSQLTALSLTGNLIASIAPNALVKLTALRTLDLANNRLRVIEPGTFSGQSELRRLQLSGNPLDTLPFDCFTGLASVGVLSLDYVPTDEVRADPDTMTPFRSLVRLDVDGSPGVARSLFAWKKRLADSVPTLQELSLRSSDLARLRLDDLPPAVRQTESSTALRISSSRWHCDLDLVWLRDRLIRQRSAAEAAGSAFADDGYSDEENRCATPKRLAGRLVTSLENNEFEPVQQQTHHHRVSSTASLPSSRAATTTSKPPPRASNIDRPFQHQKRRNSTSDDEGTRLTGNDARGPGVNGHRLTSTLALNAKNYDTVESASRPYLQPERWLEWDSEADDVNVASEIPADGYFRRKYAMTTSREGIVRYRYNSVDSLRQFPSLDETVERVTRRSTQGRAVPAIEQHRAPLPVDDSERNAGSDGGSVMTTTIYAVAATVGITVVLAAIIIAVIIRLVRDKKSQQSEPTKSSTSPATGDSTATSGGRPIEKLPAECPANVETNAMIEYRHRNALIYFAPSTSAYTSVSGTIMPPPPPDVADVTPTDERLTSGGSIASANVARDNNMYSSKSSEPLRVYKWEDF